jgi:hypothetical protein
MTEHTGAGKSRAEIERRRAARRDNVPIGVAVAAAVAALAVSDPNDPGDTVIWAVPMLALLGLALRGELRDLRRADEYERTLLLESLALGFVVVIVLLFVGFIGGLLGWSAIKAVRTRRG